MTTARRIFRLFKSLNEYVAIKKLLVSDHSKLDVLLQVTTSFAYMFYWLFDNLAVLIKIKLIRSLNYRAAIKRAY